MSKIKICLDAGHYGKYNQCPAIPLYFESEMVWKLHLLLKKYLEEYGFEVIQTRAEQDKDMKLFYRGTASKGCDLFLSIHSNAVGSNMNEDVDYPVVYVPVNGKGDKVGNMLATCIEEAMGTKQKGRIATRKNSNGNDYYGVIRGADSVGVPGLILEHSFHTNAKAVRWLMQEENLDKLAKAEADTIAKYYGVERPVSAVSSGNTDTPPKTKKVIYRVQTGAYKSKTNADKQLARVKAAGFDAIMVEVNGLYKIQVGAFSVYGNAIAQQDKLKKAGFGAFVTVGQ